tara:strand:+ start:323 stop:520 length:198 start_codon:yes stop_codon:yes gene_type:complete
MNRLVKILKKVAIELVLNDETKAKVIEQLNKKINLPMISEDTERELMESLYEALQEAIAEAIESK